MFGPLQGIVQDTRYALRTLRTSPAFTIAAIGTLALGIGADRQVMSLVMKEAAVLVAIGVAIGAVCSLVFAGPASPLLLGLKQYNRRAFKSAAIRLAAVARRGGSLPPGGQLRT